MASTAAAAARDARRRKIVERGADRIALITGRVPSLPSQSSSDANLEPSADSSLQLNSDHGQFLPPYLHTEGVTADEPAIQPPNPPPNNQIEQPLLQKTTDLADVDANEGHVSGIQEERPVHDGITGRLEQNPAAVGAASTASADQLLRGGTRQRRVSMSPSQISSGITASERTRVLCSVAIAILVVSSTLGLPLIGNDTVKGILSFRPLYLLLVTNATIVLAAILSNNNNRRGSAMVDGGAAGIESDDWAAQASKALEIGFVAKKAVEALLMDVSVYAVIVVCAFCLLR